MLVKTAASKKSAKPQPVLTAYILIKLPMTTKTFTACVDHPSEWKTTSTVTPLEKNHGDSRFADLPLSVNDN